MGGAKAVSWGRSRGGRASMTWVLEWNGKLEGIACETKARLNLAADGISFFPSAVKVQPSLKPNTD